jgi:glutathione S-transferase
MILKGQSFFRNLHGDSCFLPQEKLKVEYLEQLPGMVKLFSQFLGQRTWFVGEKVKGEKLSIVILLGDRIPCHLSFVALCRLLL